MDTNSKCVKVHPPLKQKFPQNISLVKICFAMFCSEVCNLLEFKLDCSPSTKISFIVDRIIDRHGVLRRGLVTKTRVELGVLGVHVRTFFTKRLKDKHLHPKRGVISGPFFCEKVNISTSRKRKLRNNPFTSSKSRWLYQWLVGLRESLPSGRDCGQSPGVSAPRVLRRNFFQTPQLLEPLWWMMSLGLKLFNWNFGSPFFQW